MCQNTTLLWSKNKAPIRINKKKHSQKRNYQAFHDKTKNKHSQSTLNTNKTIISDNKTYFTWISIINWRNNKTYLNRTLHMIFFFTISRAIQHKKQTNEQQKNLDDQYQQLL